MSEQIETVTCPICGKEAEIGAIYSPSWLEWISGKPNWKKRFIAELGLGGMDIGKAGLPMTWYVPGIYCRSCSQVVVHIEPRRKHFPEVKE